MTDPTHTSGTLDLPMGLRVASCNLIDQAQKQDARPQNSQTGLGPDYCWAPCQVWWKGPCWQGPWRLLKKENRLLRM